MNPRERHLALCRSMVTNMIVQQRRADWPSVRKVYGGMLVEKMRVVRTDNPMAAAVQIIEAGGLATGADKLLLAVATELSQ